MGNTELNTSVESLEQAAINQSASLVDTQKRALRVIQENHSSSQSVWAWTVDMLHRITWTEKWIDIVHYAELVNAKAGLIMSDQLKNNQKPLGLPSWEAQQIAKPEKLQQAA